MTCNDCKRETKKGYTLKHVHRCDQCWELFIIRGDRKCNDYKPANTDRERRTKHRSLAT